MQIAKRLEKIRPSMTLAISAKAQEMRATGLEVISLAVGEPDFHTPEYIKDAARRALDENFTKYTPVAGIPELRKEAANYFNHYYNANLDLTNIIIGAGGKQCIYAFLQTTINPGDEVLIPSPYWVSYPDMVLLAGATPRFIETASDTGYKITPALLDATKTARTKLLIINTPSNPTGSIYSADELLTIVEWCARNRVFLLSDEIYDQLVYAPAKMASASSLFQQFPDSIAIVNGLSKSFAMTGWRIGFLGGPREIINKMIQLQGHSLGNISSITQKAGLAALQGPDTEIKIMKDAFEKRRNLGESLIAQWEKAKLVKPEGAFYFFVNVRNYYTPQVSNSLEFCDWLLEEAHVAAVPGASFGNDDFIRLSYAVSEKTLEQALTRIGNSLKRL